MAAKPPQQQVQKPHQQMGGSGGESLAAQIAGMSKNQLYEIMCQMKNLIEQNPQQARQILIDNPKLTKALFQAQIMLGMVQPPKVLDSSRRSNRPLVCPSVSVPPLAFQSQSMAPVQAKGTLNAHMSPAIPSHHNLPPPPPIPQHSILQSHIPMVSSQSQQSLQTSGILLQPLQSPMPQQQRPPSIPSFPQSLHPQMPPGLGFQLASAQQHVLPQSMFHPGVTGSFPLGQPAVPNQPSHQQLYQGASVMASEFSGQVGSSGQVERAPSWATTERGAGGSLLPGPPPPPTMGGQPLRPPQVTSPLTAEMEQALLQQVMSLTPEQISQLPLNTGNMSFRSSRCTGDSFSVLIEQ
ncbi:unnamed protein product [Spirodela intermedia]|uniref:Cleavage stimulation factor subunit 2 hinge domain-containing protein n=1 Tax=Spirodela intermedia TaxID=51605 RepID=A0A7I8J5K9_SPIIN|nr:unnamed protein product [Spirodela intermedia]CAA6665349.1 unnamed protein product [Spirodela intermedia]